MVIKKVFPFLLIGLLCSVNRVAGQEQQKLTAVDAAEGDAFARAVGTDGTRIIVGAVGNDDDGENTGSAYIFTNDSGSWVQEQKLTADDGTPTDRFGWDVDIDGNLAVVSAAADLVFGAHSGSAYTFRYDGGSWEQEDKLTASVGLSAELFGEGVGVSGDAVVIGASGNLGNGAFSGGAFVFRYDGSDWMEEEILLASDGGSNDSFGNRAVAIDGNVIAVGAAFDSDVEQGAGSAYVFRHDGSTWAEEEKLTGSDSDFQDSFGTSVAVDGDRIVVGAPGAAGNEIVAGAAYVFRYDGSSWQEEAKLFADDGRTSDYFGGSVAISGDVLVVGAIFHASPGVSTAGAAYVYRYENGSWRFADKLIPSDLFFEDRFGNTLEVFGSTVLVGSPDNDDHGNGSGSAYVFDVSSVVDARETETSPESEMSLRSAYPNPFRGRTALEFVLDTAAPVTVTIFDVTGRPVFNSGPEYYTPGEHTIAWTPSTRLPAGVYFVRLAHGLASATRTLVLVK